MTRLPLHPEETRRLLAVQAQLAAGRRRSDDRVLRTVAAMAARLLDVPVAMITLVDEHDTHVVVAHGASTGPRERWQTMCAWAVASDSALAVPDLATDPRFRDGAVVASGLRAYHGVPLRSRDGLPLGALCVFDVHERHLDAAARELVRELALLAESHLALTVALDEGASPTQGAAAGPAVALGPVPPEQPEPVPPVLDVAEGLAAGEIVPFYQPIVSLSDGRIVGVEALVRWEHPSLGLLAPAAFLPTAEADQLVLAIDALMLEEACTQVQHWRTTRPDAAALELSVNVSGHHLEAGSLVELVAAALASSGLPAHALTLELTETVLVASGDEQTVRQLQEVRDLGVGLALDDFGTAYSTLTYLRRFPVTRLKVDRSFVRGLGVDRRDALLVGSVVSLARGLGLDVVGEGVETSRQAALLRRLGCDKAQGYHFHRPSAPEQLELSGRLGPLGVPADGTVGGVLPFSFGLDDDVAAPPDPHLPAARPVPPPRVPAAC